MMKQTVTVMEKVVKKVVKMKKMKAKTEIKKQVRIPSL